MTHSPIAVSRVTPFRWLILALVVSTGLVLYLWYAPDTDPVAIPTEMEQLP